MTPVHHYDCVRCGSHDELPPEGGHLSCTCPDGDAIIGYHFIEDGQIKWFNLNVGLKP